MVGFDVNPGYKVYISEAYLENDKEMCSDIFNQTDTSVVWDCSGYCNNGELYTTDDTGYFLSEKGSPRYSYAINPHSLNSTSNAKAGTAYIRGNCELATPNTLTIAFWAYPRA